MDNASDYGSEDSRFESWQVRNFCWSRPVKIHLCIYNPYAFEAISHQSECVVTWSVNDICTIEAMIYQYEHICKHLQHYVK